ncbi:MAG TPA: hypothetical protein VF230_05050 [Acidimicrobiales bacterium]
MTPLPATPAPVASADRTEIAFGDAGEKNELQCLYVRVDCRGRSDVADFLHGWTSCCDEVRVDWQSLRRPLSALVSLEFACSCGTRPERMRVVFDVRRDREALDALVATQVIVVGNRPYGGFANAMAAYTVDAGLVRSAVEAAEHGLRQLSAIAN